MTIARQQPTSNTLLQLKTAQTVRLFPTGSATSSQITRRRLRQFLTSFVSRKLTLKMKLSQISETSSICRTLRLRRQRRQLSCWQTIPVRPLCWRITSILLLDLLTLCRIPTVALHRTIVELTVVVALLKEGLKWLNMPITLCRRLMRVLPSF